MLLATLLPLLIFTNGVLGEESNETSASTTLQTSSEDTTINNQENTETSVSISTNASTSASSPGSDLTSLSGSATSPASAGATDEPSTTASTTQPTTTPQPSRPSRKESDFLEGNFCTCDLIPDSCDANCCCDKECSRDDREAFSYCQHQLSRNNFKRYCISEELIYTNNTQYVAEKEDNSLLCIYADNFDERLQYLERKPTENLTEFAVLQARHSRVKWKNDYEVARQAWNYSNNYAAGKTLLVRYRLEKTVGHWFIPSSRGLSARSNGDCGGWRPVKFMESESSTCHLHSVKQCDKIPQLDVNNYVRNIEILRQPTFDVNQINDTDEDVSDLYAMMTIYTCITTKVDDTCDDFTEWVGSNFPRPTKNCNTNLLVSLHFDVHHDGLQGVQLVEAFAVFLNPRSNKELERGLTQSFSYAHHWTGGSNLTDTDGQPGKVKVEVRSGNPGYLVGKPVISGTMTYNKTLNSWKVNTDVDPEKKVTVFAPDQTGLCDFLGNKRSSLKFGINVHQGCSIYLNRSSVTNLCQRLKFQSFKMLVGSWYASQLSERYVATFGNSHPNKTGDWVKALYLNIPDYRKSEDRVPGRCINLVRSLHIEILHAKIGSLTNPQQKIVGVAYRFGKPRDLIFNCVGMACNHRSKTQRIDFSVTVSFHDISESAVRQYMEYPILEAKFPHDFFYPFVSSGVSSTCGANLSLLTILGFFLSKTQYSNH